jgi:Fe-S cluster assembly ATP-binding protein
MGPNGSGKSTLSNVLAGKPCYEVTGGSVDFLGQDLLDLAPEHRAALGLFLAFQYPVAIPGVNNLQFLKTAFNSIRKKREEPLLDAMDFIAHVKEKLAALAMDEKFLHRAVNAGFSGGEMKRNAILQMLVLSPSFCILDETDSGLDIDALQVIAKGVNAYRSASRGLLLVTHYQRLLDYIQPDYVHVMLDGRIVKSGDASLALTLEEKGYAWLQEEAAS